VNVPGGHNDVFESEQFTRALARFTSGISGCSLSPDTSAV
jgi:hypothetical protein